MPVSGRVGDGSGHPSIQVQGSNVFSNVPQRVEARIAPNGLREPEGVTGAISGCYLNSVIGNG